MSARYLFLDTETTGLEPHLGHKIIEIGCVEMIDRRLTGNHYQQFLNPEREIDEGALAVHGISLSELEDKPTFASIADDFLAYIKDATLIIHNAAFDLGFLDHELAQLPVKRGHIADYCAVIDTLEMAREIHPGQRNSLDALCQRYHVDNQHRTLHGALLDSEILADVYLMMTGGQLNLLGDDEATENVISDASPGSLPDALPIADKVVNASEEEMREHRKWLQLLSKQIDSEISW